MKEALKLAKEAEKTGEVPVGAIITYQGKIIARAMNQKEKLKSAIFHAEILAIKEASLKLQDWRLTECELYVTLEPCPMCAGAIVASRLKRLIYGCKDPKAGAVHSLYKITEDKRLNHQVEVCCGILAEESSQLLKNFFNKKRKK